MFLYDEITLLFGLALRRRRIVADDEEEEEPEEDVVADCVRLLLGRRATAWALVLSAGVGEVARAAPSLAASWTSSSKLALRPRRRLDLRRLLEDGDLSPRRRRRLASIIWSDGWSAALLLRELRRRRRRRRRPASTGSDETHETADVDAASSVAVIMVSSSSPLSRR